MTYRDQETNAIVTEEMIERAVESKINSLDRRFMKLDMGQDAYDENMRDIREWAERCAAMGEMPYGC